MSPADIIAKLDELHATGKFHGFSIWPTGKGDYQFSLATTSKTNWRIRRADTPSEGLGLVLDMDFMDNGVSQDGREPEMVSARDDFDEAALPDEARDFADVEREAATEAVGIFD